MYFKNAIVKIPSKSLVKGLTQANLGLPDYEKAIIQHEAYVTALKGCDLNVHILEADENFPDSTFVEDTALLSPRCAIITNPGAPSRRDEVINMKGILKEYYHEIEEIQSPGTIEAGDIMMVTDHFYIGLSERTNLEGAEQIIKVLNKYDLTGSIIEVKEGLHLKSSMAYLENNNLLATSEFSHHEELRKFNILEIPQEENYAANCIWINDRVIIPKGFPKTKQIVVERGYSILEIDVSEFRKVDGGLSCLSLRF